jgi:2-dehydro-3-deoxygalactonokinase
VSAAPDGRATATATALIALDWGTTSARAYRLDANGAVRDVRSAPLGIQHVAEGAFDAALASLLGDWRDDPAPRLACGMIGSRQGWVEAPYCETPVSLAGLAGGIVDVPGARLRIVPGVRTRDASGLPDVMRGEETQILGAIDPMLPRSFAVLPGTHSKWARVEQGRLVSFSTYMTGEAYDALLHHTILGRLATPAATDAVDGEGFRRGLERGLESAAHGGALLHDAFGARTLALFGELAPTGVADWLSGLLIGAEIAGARRVAPDMTSVVVIGNAALARRYVDACTHAGLVATAAAPDAAARGLWRLARAA